MSKNTVIDFTIPSDFSPDPLTDVLRQGARELLATAVRAEVSEFLAGHVHLLDDAGRQRLVRHGFLPEREVLTGIGKVSVQVPRVRDRGESADGLSASTITRLKATWWDEYEAWRKRDLTGKRYVYIWADGVYFNPRLDDDRQCMLVIIGADEYGDKDVLGIMDGFRENADSWRDLLRSLQKRGLTTAPDLACGDGALGFWTALRDVYPSTKEQRCWVHKMANITGAMPKPMHEKAKAGLQDIWMAETKKQANAAFDLFVETYGVKYERAVKKLTKDRDVLLTFYDFPAEHRKHIRTTNPIESVFATVRNRTRKTKGCLSRKTALSMVFKLMMSAKKKWRKLSGTNRLPEVIQGLEFKDGIKQLQNAA